LAGRVKVTTADDFTDSSAAYGFAIQRHRRDSVHYEAKFLTELSKQRHITAPLVSKDKVRSHAKTLQATWFRRQRSHKDLGGLPAECLIEMNEQKAIRAQGFNRSELLRQRINERRHPIQRNNSVWVAIERDDQGGRLMMSRIGQGLADYLLMTQMHPIKKADGDA
jgi:hypothetical protein